MKSFILLFTLLLIFTSCSKKTEQLNTSSIIKTTKNDLYEKDSQESFDEEFEDNFDQKEDLDPLKYYNIFMTSFNDKAFIYVLNPVSKAYSYVIPKPARTSVSNFFQNIFFPIRLVNNLLQLKFENSAEETGRFLINSTVGLLGLFDPAKSYFDLSAHNEDFGQTLGFWGVGPGFHIVLPLLGPSNLRDALALNVDSYFNPTVSQEKKSYKIPKNLTQSALIYSLYSVNKTSLRLGQYEDIKKDALELYPFFKYIYEENRKQQIKE